ncbi:MAG: ATP-dependent Clp protease ATP-binding subunit [Myxococcales bacterium]|nr:ATP-dependent Clp protease ATP-binding subunit [Myxococcales bacterium]MCB9627784.1 ATP-dependent Clp protease ATP-binding subunit [Sandaracinaceae bacterium]
MNFTVAVYQRKLAGGTLEWRTLGLGAQRDVTLRGQSTVKLESQLRERLQRHMATDKPADLRCYSLARGMSLERPHLELTLRGEQRLKVSGRFPLVLAPHQRTAGAQLVVAYHPQRPLEWFAVEEGAPLAEQATRFFRHAWADCSAWELERLETDGHDLIRAVAFSARVPTLLDGLQSRRGPFDDLDEDPARRGGRSQGSGGKGGKPNGLGLLGTLGTDLTLRAADGRLPRGQPRPELRDAFGRLLGTTQLLSLVALGSSGAGKTTALYQLVYDLLDADDYAAHGNLDRVTHVVSLSGKRIIAGMSHVGEWEERVVTLLRDARAARVVVWLEDLHTMGKLGQSRDSTRAVSDLLRGPVARGELCIIGEATPAQWDKLREDAPAFADLFAEVRVPAATPAEALRMMLARARELEATSPVRFDPPAFRTLLELAQTLFHGTALPGAALAWMSRLPRYADGDHLVDQDSVVDLVSERTGLPSELLRPTEPLSPADVRVRLEERVVGQGEALDAVIDVVMRIHAGLTDPGRPYATYLFTGPTGTGKTELAKALSDYLYGSSARLLRFDMGEYNAPDAPARLIGDRFRPRGALTEAVRQTPFSVVLFDEIEKAHQSVHYLLLQLLDEGRLSDAEGNEADFTHAVILMTSNLGAEPQASVGFGDRPASADNVTRDVKAFFPPELYNRIDRVVRFHPFSAEVAASVAEKELTQLLARRGLLERQVFVFTTQSATARMVREGFDPFLGARSLKRYLERYVGHVLAEEVAGHTRAEMRIVRVYDAEGEYRLHVDTLREAEPSGGELRLLPLLDRSPRELVDELPGALRIIDSLLAGPLLEQAVSELRKHLPQASEGQQEHADHVHRAELVRGELQAFRDRLEAWVHHDDWMEEGLTELALETFEPRSGWNARVRLLHPRYVLPDAPRLSRKDTLLALAETWFLERATRAARDAAQHSVFVELLRVGQGRNRRVMARDEDLFGWLIEAYRSGRGVLVAAAVALPDGARREFGFDELGQLGLRENHGATRVVLKFVGLGVTDFFRGEEGCHVRTSMLSGSEVVRVRLVPDGDDATPLELLLRSDRERADFERALERGDVPLPPDPDGLLPCVRRVRFDPPLRPGELSPMEVEDFRLGTSGSHQCRRLADVLPHYWSLRASERLPEDA